MKLRLILDQIKKKTKKAGKNLASEIRLDKKYLSLDVIHIKK